MSKDANFGLRLVVQRCSGQKWMIRNWIKHPRHWSPRTTSETVWAEFQVAVGSQTVDSWERSRDWWCQCVVFHTTDCTAHWVPLRPQSFPTLSLKEESDQFVCSTCSQRPYGKLHCLKRPKFLTFSDMYRTEWRDTRVQPLKVVQDPSNSFVSTLKPSDLWRWESACERVGFFPECIWANQKTWLLSIATSKWLFWAVIWKIALDILCCTDKTCNRLQRGCPSSDRGAFHLHSHKPLQFFVSLDCIAHWGQEQSCAFFLIFLLIWPGNVSPKSMYKIIWKLLIYKTMYKTVQW